MEKIGTGLASYGMSGQVFHGPLLYADPGFRLVSILERSKNLSASRFPEARVVREYRDMLEDDRVELVVVNTPDAYHYEMTRLALEAGKHVVVEKPFVQVSSQGKELITLAAKNELVLSVFQNRRWDGDFMTVKQIIDRGYLERLVEYEAHFDRYRNFIPEGTWKEDPDSGTGTLYNLGSHLIDQAFVLFGAPLSVNADIRIQRSGGRVDDVFTLWLGYKDTRVTLKASYLVREPGPRYQLHGTAGSYIKYGMDPQEEALKKGGLPGGSDWGLEPEEEWGMLNAEFEGQHYHSKYETLPGNYPAFYANIYAAIRKGDDLYVSPADANMVIEIIEAARDSSRTGNRVSLTC